MLKWVGIAAAGAFGLCVAGVALVAGLQKKALSDFDAFVARHPVGSSMASLAEDAHLEKLADELTSPLGAGPRDGAWRTQFRASLRERAPGSGEVELMWYYLPPFGRLFYRVKWVDGVITEAKDSSLD